MESKLEPIEPESIKELQPSKAEDVEIEHATLDDTTASQQIAPIEVPAVPQPLLEQQEGEGEEFPDPYASNDPALVKPLPPPSPPDELAPPIPSAEPPPMAMPVEEEPPPPMPSKPSEDLSE